MNVRWLCLVLCLLSPPALAQGFAGMGASAEGFAEVTRDYALTFPKDHGPHPDFRIEWWYVTANLTGEDGRDYGVQWTLFRSPLAPDGPDSGWQSRQIWMGHAALTTPERHFVGEKFARGAIGQAGVKAQPFEAWIDDWSLAGENFDTLQMKAGGADFSFDLSLRADGPLVLDGDNGVSVKSSNGMASYYYSQPAYQVAGVLNLPDGPVQVTGNAWLDREWSSQPLSGDQSGWDWVALSFDDESQLMAGRVRNEDELFTAATWISPDKSPTTLGNGDVIFTELSRSSVAERNVPTRWRIEVPTKGISVEIDAVNPQAWMATLFPYWEGPVTITGSHTGRGYLEMTGY